MKNEEAKFLLGAYRAGGADSADPMFAEALKQAETDPVLRGWFDRKQRYDSVVTAKLGQIAPPAGLRNAILAGGKASARPRTARGLGVWLGAAAAAAIMVVMSQMLLPHRVVAAPSALAEFAINDVAFGDHETQGAGVRALRARLSQDSTRLRQGLAMDLSQLRALGCRRFKVGGAETFEVCFQRNGTWFHLYVSTGDGRQRSPDNALVVKQDDKFGCAAWVDAATGLRYAVVSDRGIDAVKSLL